MQLDKTTTDKIALAHPAIQSDLKEIQAELDERLNQYVRVRFTHSLRTWAEQDEKYAEGRTKPGSIVTYAKGGDSWHNYGLAVDTCLLIDKDKNGTFEEASWDFFKDHDKDGAIDFEEIDFVFKKHDFVGLYKANGTRWDFPHFQKTFGLTIAEAKRRYLAKDFISGTTYIRLV